jgi:excisionase family DNA binding protein
MHNRKEKKPGHGVQQALLTVAQAAVVLGVHRSTVYDLIRTARATRRRRLLNAMSIVVSILAESVLCSISHGRISS